MCAIPFQVRITRITKGSSVNKVTSAMLDAGEIDISMRMAILIGKEVCCIQKKGKLVRINGICGKVASCEFVGMVLKGWDYFACYISLEVMHNLDIHDWVCKLFRNKDLITMEILLNSYLSVITREREKVELGGVAEVMQRKNSRL